MGAGLFTALQYETIQKTQGEALTEFLQKLDIARPDFSTGDHYALSSSLNEEIVSKICQRLHAKTLRKGCEALLTLANLSAPRSDTNEEIFARIAEHRGDILEACKQKRSQSRKTLQAEYAPRTTQRPSLGAGNTAGKDASLFHNPVVLTGAGVAIVTGGVAAVAGASAGAVVAVGGIAGVASGAVAHHLKQTAINARRRAKQLVKRPQPSTHQISPATTAANPKPAFSWDNTRVDELAETLDIIAALSSLAAASHRA